MQKRSTVLLLTCLLSLTNSLFAWQADNENGTFTNPLFYDEFSDPDLIRVGDDFYLTGTTMHTMPGLPILHSKDLINWELLTYAFEKLDLSPELRMEDDRTFYGQGIWAPSFRYHDGTFYIFSNVNRNNTQLYTATDPKGPWTHKTMDCALHDLSVLFDDDGKVWVVWGYQDLHLAQLNEDLTNIIPETERIIIKRGSPMGEGVHFYKFKGKYFLTSAWFVGRMRMPCARADRPEGPWEINEAISMDEDFGLAEGNRLGQGGNPPFNLVPGNTHNGGRMSLHQGGIVDTPTGEWWGFSMMDYNSAGRMLGLSPVTWKDGWPYFGLPGNLKRTPRTWVKPNTGYVSEPKVPYQRNDDFSGTLANVWQWNHVPVDEKWSFARPGYLRLNSLPAEDFWHARNTLTQRGIGPISIPTAELEVSGLQDGDIAGLALLNLPYAWIGVKKQGHETLLQSFNQFTGETTSIPLLSERVWLRAHCDYLTEKATFSYSLDGRAFEPFGAEFTMIFQLVTFQGTRYGLFNFNTLGIEGGYADFDRFTVDEPHPRGLMREIPYGQTVTFAINGRPALLGTQEATLAVVSLGSETARFKVVDCGLGRVALEQQGSYLSVAGPQGPVTLEPGKPGKHRDAEMFQWTENVYGDLILMSLLTHCHLRVNPEDGAVTVDHPGPYPDRKDGSCFTWKVVADEPKEKPLSEDRAVIRVTSKPKAISQDLFGIFFEDINYAADGGLYAELVQNRSFEYHRRDNIFWHTLSYWELIEQGEAKACVMVTDELPLHENNPHYAVLTVEQVGERVGLRNGGFDGIPIRGRDSYDVSVFARVLSGDMTSLTVRLETLSGESLGQTQLTGLTDQWAQYTAVIKAQASDKDARLVVLADATGSVALDMVSLFPQKTFKNRPNGLRRDLAKVIADLKPKFVRFPGGCLAHGDGLENMYRWKDTIGPVEQRKAQRNIWRYHQTMGLGYYEYFQFCEDIGAKPLPVVPAGVCCQNSGNYLGLVPRGQQGIPMDEMPAYVQEVLDLIEWANGPADSEWGSKRAAAGHPEPFGLEYLGVGNEDQITEVFRERYKMINDAVKAKYPEIMVIGTTGPATEGRDYEEGWKFARQEKLPMVDEHGYRSPTWFWQHLERFDVYDRNESKVYLGEYAAHDQDRANTLRSALSEAAYNIGLERNADHVRLASYAPLLSKQGRTQWRPDMIYFDNVSITRSLNYYVQQMFDLNQGDVYHPTTITVKAGDKPEEPEPTSWPNGILLGSWDSQVEFDDVKVVKNDKTLLDESFESQPDEPDAWHVIDGQWQVTKGLYTQQSNAQPALIRYGFEDDRSGYTLTCRARKLNGAEGFLIGFGARDDHNYYWFNLGGWGNTLHAIERATDGTKSVVGRQLDGSVEANRWYDIKVELTEKRFRCYLDGEKLFDESYVPVVKTPDLAASCLQDTATGDVILKIVSKSDLPIKAKLDLSELGPFDSVARCTLLTGEPMDENRFGQRSEIRPRRFQHRAAASMPYEIPAHSMTVLRFKPKSK